jgi:hypothetical protein
MKIFIVYFFAFLTPITTLAEVCVENATGLSEAHFAFQFIPNITIDRSKPGVPLVTEPKYITYYALENQDVSCVPYDDKSSGMAGHLAVFINDHGNYNLSNDFLWVTKQAYSAGADQTLILSVRLPSSGTVAIKRKLDEGKWSSVPAEKVIGFAKN